MHRQDVLGRPGRDLAGEKTWGPDRRRPAGVLGDPLVIHGCREDGREVGKQDTPVGWRDVLLLKCAVPCLHVGRANGAEPPVAKVRIDVHAKARLGGFAGGLVERLGGEPLAGVPTQADSSCLRVDVGPSQLVCLDGDEEGFGGALVPVREGPGPLAAIRVGVADAVAKTPPHTAEGSLLTGLTR